MRKNLFEAVGWNFGKSFIHDDGILCPQEQEHGGEKNTTGGGLFLCVRTGQILPQSLSATD